MSILSNYPLVASIVAILFAQFVKFPISYFFKKNPDTKVSIMTSTGGMPSSHSAAVSALITALVLQYGAQSPFVAIATTFGVIVMFDAMAVRRQSGEQGILLFYLYKEYLKQGGSPLPDTAVDEISSETVLEQKQNLTIQKYLGHKPIEVFAGILTGISISILLQLLFYSNR